MDFEQELKRLADTYVAQGYQVVVHPGVTDLPPFAKDFKVEIVGKRGTEGVIVAVKKNQALLAADTNMPGYAEITNSQAGWRFDLAVVQAEDPAERELRGAQEQSDEDINKSLDEADQLVHSGFIRPAMSTAWAALEAVMRMRLRAAGETADWGTMPRQMMNELYSTGVLPVGEFRQLERVYRLRNEITHGFASPSLNSGAVQFLIETARRLQKESHPAKQSA